MLKGTAAKLSQLSFQFFAQDFLMVFSKDIFLKTGDINNQKISLS